MASRVLRKLNYVVMVVGGLLLLAYGIMSTPWFRHKVEAHVVAEIEKVTGGRVEVREFVFRPLAFLVILRGFVLHGTEPSTAPPLFSARALVLGIDPSTILRQNVSLRSLSWDHAEVRVQTNPDGSTNLPGPALDLRDPNNLAEILNLSIGSVTFLQTNVVYNNQKIPLALTARDVAFQLRGSLLHHYQGSLSSSQMNLKNTRWELPAGTLAARFHFTHADFALDSLTWRSPAFNGTASLKAQLTPSLQATCEYSANGDYAALVRAMRATNPGAGEITLHGAAAYGSTGWTLQGQAQAHHLVIPSRSFNPGRMELSAHYAGNARHLAISNLKASVMNGSAEGKGEIIFGKSEPEFDFQTDLRDFDLATAAASLPELHTISTYVPPAGTLAGTLSAKWKGPLRDFEAQFNVQLTPGSKMGAGSVPIGGNAKGKVLLDHAFRVEFDEARIQTPHSSIFAQGTAAESESDLSVHFTTSDFGEWQRLAQYLLQEPEPIPLKLASEATFIGTITGPVGAADIRGRLETGQFVYRDWLWDSFAGTVGATPTYVEINSGHLRSGTAELDLDTSVHLNDWILAQDAPAHLAASAQHVSIKGLQTSLHLTYPVSGDLSGHITLDGTPRSLSGDGEIRIDRGHIYSQPFDSFAAKIVATNSAWRLENLVLRRDTAQMTGKAEYSPADRNLSVELHGRDFSPAAIKSMAQAQGLGPQFQYLDVAAANFDILGRGTPNNFDLNSNLDLRDVKIHGTPIGDLHSKLDLKEKQLQFELQCNGQGGQFHLTGSARTEGDWPMTLSGDYTGFRADPWFRLVSGDKFNARVTSTGTISARGPLKDFSRIEAEGQTKTLEVNVADMAWSNAGPIDLKFAQRVLSFQPFEMRGPSTDLEVQGSIHFATPAILNLTAHGTSDNTLLSLLDPAIHATGHSELNLNLSGSPVQPVLHGTLKVQDLNLAYGDFPFHLSGLSGEIQLEGDRATAKSLRGQIGGGVATLSGYLTVTATPRFNFQANLEQVRVQYPPNFTSLLAGTLNLVGSTEGGRLEGDLTIKQMFASENFNVLSLLTEVNAPGGMQTTVVPSSFASKIRLDVGTSSDPDVRIETRDLRVVADIDLSLQGTLANPVEVGTIHILSGEALVRGNRFHLDRGDVTMANPFRTQPVLDLQARTRIQRYDVTMDISGPIEQMKMAYRADPPLPTADILSLLALGYVRNTGELATTNRSFSNVGASALLSQALSSQTTGRIQRLFGVSRIKIDPNVGDPTNISGTRVTIEQQVSHDLTITYATNTGTTQQRVIQFEWALSDRVSLIGVRDQNGIFGAEVIFRRRFK